MSSSETRTLAFPTALDWSLARIHFMRSAWPGVLIVTTIYVTLYAVIFFLERLKQVQPSDTAELLDKLPLIVPFLAAFPIGSGTFSRSFKESHILFFHSLPASRTRQWLILCATNLAVLVTVSALAFAFRPSAIKSITLLGPHTGPSPIVAVLALFAAGCAFGLIFANAAAVYVGGAIFSILLIAICVMAGAAPIIAHRGLTLFAEEFGNPLPLDELLSVALSVLTIYYFAVSLICFRRGEVALPRSQVRNGMIAVAVGSILLTIATPIAMAVQAHSRWPDNGYDYFNFTPDGQHYVRDTQNELQSWKTRIVFGSTHDGVVGARVENGVDGFAWLNSKECIVLQNDASLLHKIVGYDANRILHFSATGDELRAERIEVRLRGVRVLPSGRVILVTSKEGIGTVWDYRGRGSMEPLATAPLDTDGWPLIGVNFVFFWNRVTAPRFFRADNGTYREARFEKITTDMRPVALLDRVFSSHEEARAYLERTNPPPRSTNEHVAYSLAGIAALDTIYALVTSSEPTGRLYVLDFQKNAWQLVDSDVHVATDVPYSAATFEKLSSVASSRTSPTIFYVALVKSRLVLRRYAPGEARPRDLLQIPEGGPTGLSVSRLGAPRGAVAVALRPHGADPQSPARAVVVDFGDGAPVSVPVHPGSLRARTSQGEDVWYVGGPELSVWSGTRERRVKMN